MGVKSICFITNGDMKNNASPKRSLGFAKCLSFLGWDVFLIIEDTEENRHQVELLQCSTINTYFYNFSNVKEEIRFKNSVVSKICPNYIYVSYFRRQNKVNVPEGCKVIVEHCELYSHYHEYSFQYKCMSFIKEMASLLYADGVVNASGFLQRVNKKRAKCILRKNLPMLYLPYSFDSKKTLIINPEITKQKEEEETLFVYLGAMREQYGVFTILEAARILSEKHDFKLFFLGSGNDIERIKNRIAEYKLEKHVFLKGFVKEEDIHSYFTIADAFISPMNNTPQDWARCPSKLYMYLPYQKPIITCKIGEPYEALKDKGYYYKTGDPKSMADCMKKVIENKNVGMGYCANKYSWGSATDKFISWLDTL